MKVNKGRSQPQIAPAACLILYMVLGRPFYHQVLIATHIMTCAQPEFSKSLHNSTALPSEDVPLDDRALLEQLSDTFGLFGLMLASNWPFCLAAKHNRHQKKLSFSFFVTPSFLMLLARLSHTLVCHVQPFAYWSSKGFARRSYDSHAMYIYYVSHYVYVSLKH